MSLHDILQKADNTKKYCESIKAYIKNFVFYPDNQELKDKAQDLIESCLEGITKANKVRNSNTEKLKVVSIGCVSSGKSTLLNCLLKRKDLLPVDIGSTTNRLIYVYPLEYLDENEYFMYENQRYEIDDLSSMMADLVDENDDKSFKVYLKITDDSILKDVIILDTIGIDATKKVLENMQRMLGDQPDIILITISSVCTLTEPIIEFLQALVNQFSIFDGFILQTFFEKIQKKPQKEKESRMSKIKEKYKEIISDNIHLQIDDLNKIIHFVSPKKYLNYVTSHNVKDMDEHEKESKENFENFLVLLNEKIKEIKHRKCIEELEKVQETVYNKTLEIYNRNKQIVDESFRKLKTYLDKHKDEVNKQCEKIFKVEKEKFLLLQKFNLENRTDYKEKTVQNVIGEFDASIIQVVDKIIEYINEITADSSGCRILRLLFEQIQTDKLNQSEHQNLQTIGTINPIHENRAKKILKFSVIFLGSTVTLPIDIFIAAFQYETIREKLKSILNKKNQLNKQLLLDMENMWNTMIAAVDNIFENIITIFNKSFANLFPEPPSYNNFQSDTIPINPSSEFSLDNAFGLLTPPYDSIDFLNSNNTNI